MSENNEESTIVDQNVTLSTETTINNTIKKPKQENWRSGVDHRYLREAVVEFVIDSNRTKSGTGRDRIVTNAHSIEFKRSAERRLVSLEVLKQISIRCVELGMREKHAHNLELLEEKMAIVFDELHVKPRSVEVTILGGDIVTKRKAERETLKTRANDSKKAKTKETLAVTAVEDLKKYALEFAAEMTSYVQVESGAVEENLKERSAKTYRALTAIKNSILAVPVIENSADTRTILQRKVNDEMEKIFVLNIQKGWSIDAAATLLDNVASDEMDVALDDNDTLGQSNENRREGDLDTDLNDEGELLAVGKSTRSSPSKYVLSGDNARDRVACYQYTRRIKDGLAMMQQKLSDIRTTFSLNALTPSFKRPTFLYMLTDRTGTETHDSSPVWSMYGGMVLAGVRDILGFPTLPDHVLPLGFFKQAARFYASAKEQGANVLSIIAAFSEKLSIVEDTIPNLVTPTSIPNLATPTSSGPVRRNKSEPYPLPSDTKRLNQ